MYWVLLAAIKREYAGHGACGRHKKLNDYLKSCVRILLVSLV